MTRLQDIVYRVTGTTTDKNEELSIKEATFA